MTPTRTPRPHTRSRRTPRALRLNPRALVLTLVFSILLPVLVHGMSLFVAGILPLVVVATAPFALP